MESLSELVSGPNSYMMKRKSPRPGFLMQEVANYLHRMLSVYGVIQNNDLGFAASSGSENREEILAPVISAFSTFRDEVLL